MQTSRRQLLRLTAAGLAARLVPAQERKPNILMILADDLGYHDTGFNGRKEWSTPNLDRLASEGTIFDRWYTAMPVCAPSRACLMTGKYTIHTTVRNNNTDIPKTETTIAKALKAQGYTTALAGKWHHGILPGGGFTHPLEFGFDSTFGYLDAKHAWEHFPKTLWRDRQEVPVNGFSADLLADEAIRIINQKRDNPFFVYLAFIEPHFNVEAPEEDVALYRGKFKEKDPSEPYNARYAAMIHRMDAAVGRVFRALEAAGQANNTLIVFTSDNGATFEGGNKGAANYHDSNAPFRGQKRSLEEGGLRMPSFVRWPGKVPAGKRSSEVIHMTDVFPSFLAAAGTKPEPGWKVDGRNMLDVWAGKIKSPERTLFWEWQIEGGNMYAAMRGDFKFLDIGTNKFLYNLKEDPQERRTVAAEYPEIHRQLQQELKAWLATEVRPAN